MTDSTSNKTEIDYDYWRQRLLQERESRAQTLNDEANSPDRQTDMLDMEEKGFANHWGEASAFTFQQEMDLTMREKLENEIELIDEALHRINEGNYGICEITGKPIEAERLEIIPWTRFSIEGQRIYEKRHARPLDTGS